MTPFPIQEPAGTLTSVLDLGSNSFHVLVADASPDGRVVPVLREREMLHLGRAVARNGGAIPNEAGERAVATALHLTELARRAGADAHLAVATSALREASNGPEVVAAIARETGTEVRVLDGLEEARLAYIGVRASVAVTDEPVLVLDLGGGSLEFAVGSAAEVVWSSSTGLGVSRLSAEVAGDPPRREELAALVDRVDEEVRPLIGTIAELGPRQVVAIGGTVRRLAKVVAADTGTWLPVTLNQYRIPVTAIAAMRDRLVELDLDERLAVPKVDERRADHIHLAAVVLGRVLDLLEVVDVTICDWGLREGTILDAIGLGTVPDAAELRRREVERIVRSFVPDDPHMPHTAALAGGLFDQLAPLHGLGPTDRELLEHASLLHDVGEALALRGHHRHGAYLIENAEMRGFTPDETAMLVTLTRFHNSDRVDPSYLPFSGLPREARSRTERLLAILQLADGLDRARDQAVHDVTVQRHDGRVEVALHGRGLHVAGAEFDRKAAAFRHAFGLDITVVDRAGS